MGKEDIPLVAAEPIGSAAPAGRWKDGLFDCFKFGCCHPSLCCALCFRPVLMAQVLTRLKLDMFANEAPESEWRKTFKKILVLFICYSVFSVVLTCPSETEVDDVGNITSIKSTCSTFQQGLKSIVSFAFHFYTLIVLAKTRAAVRARYEIPVKNCGDMEDCCCAFWCGCCTVSQLARQTADYEQKRAVCCSETGLPPLTPVIIV